MDAKSTEKHKGYQKISKIKDFTQSAKGTHKFFLKISLRNFATLGALLVSLFGSGFASL